MKEPFEWHIFLRPEGAAGNLYWKLDYKQSALIRGYRKGDSIRFYVAPENVMLLRDE